MALARAPGPSVCKNADGHMCSYIAYMLLLLLLLTADGCCLRLQVDKLTDDQKLALIAAIPIAAQGMAQSFYMLGPKDHGYWYTTTFNSIPGSYFQLNAAYFKGFCESRLGLLFTWCTPVWPNCWVLLPMAEDLCCCVVQPPGISPSSKVTLALLLQSQLQ